MNFIEKIYNHCTNKGLTSSLEVFSVLIADTTATNIGFIDLKDQLFQFVELNGYTEDLAKFEEKYYTFWGKRPSGK